MNLCVPMVLVMVASTPALAQSEACTSYEKCLASLEALERAVAPARTAAQRFEVLKNFDPVTTPEAVEALELERGAVWEALDAARELRGQHAALARDLDAWLARAQGAERERGLSLKPRVAAVDPFPLSGLAVDANNLKFVFQRALGALARDTQSVPAGASLADRAVGTQPSRYAPTSAARLMSQVPKARVVYAARDLGPPRLDMEFAERPLRRGEALLIFEDNARGFRVVSFDGQEWLVNPEDLSARPVPGAQPVVLKPELLSVYEGTTLLGGAETRQLGVKTGLHLTHTPEWTRRLDQNDPRLATLFEARDATVACYDKQLLKLDPENRRQRYDVVTSDRRGNELKVESMVATLDRKACAVCQCQAYNDRAAKLAAEVLLPLQRARAEQLEPFVGPLNQKLLAKP